MVQSTANKMANHCVTDAEKAVSLVTISVIPIEAYSISNILFSQAKNMARHSVQECPNAAGFAHILLKDKTVADRWRELTYSRKDGRAYIFPYYQFGSVQERFGKLVKQACENLWSQHQRINKPAGTLEIERGGTNPTRPGCCFNVKWKPISRTQNYREQNIKIDLTVVIVASGK